MVANQLFRILPDIEVVQQLLHAFGLSSLDDNNFFTKNTMKEKNTADIFISMKQQLETYYLPCKSKVYIDNITDKKCITILRQFLKVHGYTLISKERYIDRKKLCVYRLIKLDDKPTASPTNKNKNIVISFE